MSRQGGKGLSSHLIIPCIGDKYVFVAKDEMGGGGGDLYLVNVPT